MLDKKGFSLVEVIICIAMMGILSVTAFSMSNHIKYADGKRCAKVLNQKIEITRMRAMSKKGNWHLYIYADGGSICYLISDQDTLDKSKGEKLGNVNLYYTTKDSSGTVKVSDSSVTGSSYIDLQFIKDTGAFRENADSSVYDNIRIAERNGTDYVIKLVQKTGKHTIE